MSPSVKPGEASSGVEFSVWGIAFLQMGHLDKWASCKTCRNSTVLLSIFDVGLKEHCFRMAKRPALRICSNSNSGCSQFADIEQWLRIIEIFRITPAPYANDPL